MRLTAIRALNTVAISILELYNGDITIAKLKRNITPKTAQGLWKKLA